MEKIGLLVPTRNGGELWRRWLEAFASQTARPEYLLVIDSSSDDSTVALAKKAGFNVRVIPKAQFNHGRTRQLGMKMLPEADIVVVMTQDAILATPDALKQMLACFADKQIGAVYGRQLPNPNAGPIGAHARLFNYPSESTVKSLADAPRLGIKAAFLSNSFAAYRRSAFLEAGGFPSDVVLGEDVYVAARMLLNSWKIAYCADAKVFHSHDYSFRQEFSRYFDIGVFHAREAWLLTAFGQIGGEGGRFVRSELNFLFRVRPLLIPEAIVRTGFKLIGYKLGKMEHWLPLWLKRRLSLHPGYWIRSNSIP